MSGALADGGAGDFVVAHPTKTTAAIVVSRWCVICLRLPVPSWSWLRVRGRGRRLRSDTNSSFYDLLFDVHRFQSHGDLSGDPLLPPKPSIHRQLFSPAISVSRYPRNLP